MSESTSDSLELKAAEERRRLQSSLEELKDRLHEKLDVNQGVRQHLWLLSGIAAIASATAGYGFGALFSRK